MDNPPPTEVAGKKIVSFEDYRCEAGASLIESVPDWFMHMFVAPEQKERIRSTASGLRRRLPTHTPVIVILQDAHKSVKSAVPNECSIGRLMHEVRRSLGLRTYEAMTFFVKNVKKCPHERTLGRPICDCRTADYMLGVTDQIGKIYDRYSVNSVLTIHAVRENVFG